MILNVHCDGGAAMMRAAVAAARKATPHPPLIIGVTLLTSLGATELHNEFGVAEDLESYVVRMARLAQDAGLDGVVTSAHEVRSIKRACGEKFHHGDAGDSPALGGRQRSPPRAHPRRGARRRAPTIW